MWEFQSPDSRKVHRRGVRRRTGWRDRRRRNRFKDDARRDVKSVPNLSPVIYSIVRVVHERKFTHSLFAWERWDCTSGEVPHERIVQVDEIGESPSNFGESALKGG
jgi:hypothetical protein